MLTQRKIEEFEESGLVVVSNFLSDCTVQTLGQAIDGLQGNTPYNDAGRWDLRNCLTHDQSFVELLVNETLLMMMVQLLDSNIKLLGSHAVKMDARPQSKGLAVKWHRDGGVLSADLPDPLPPLFVKAGFCVSGSLEPDGGELLMARGTNRLIGDPVFDGSTGCPEGASKVLLGPGDVVIFDWRTWHAVNRNSSDIVRRMLYFAFGFRWLSPIDYQVMPEDILKRSPLHRQFLGGATELGNYLPSKKDTPLKYLLKKKKTKERR